MSIAKLFSDGKKYSQFRPEYPQELYDVVEEYAKKSRKGEASDCVVLDVGCGPGEATVQLAKRYSKVIGIDPSQAQLDGAIKAEGIEYKVGTDANLPVDPSSVDLITAAQALHWFDLDVFWDQVRIALKPGGTVACWTYALPSLDNEAANAAFQKYHFTTLGPFWDKRRQLVDNQYKEITIPLSDFTRKSVTLKKVSSLADFLGYVGTSSGLKNYRNVNPDGVDIHEELGSEIMKHYKTDDPATFMVTSTYQMTILLGRKEG